MKLFAFLIFISILLSGLYFIPNADGHTELYDTQIIRAKADTITTLWTRFPATGNYYDKTFTNDTNTTYITTSTSYAGIVFDMDDYINPGIENQSINITFWITVRNTLGVPAAHVIFGITNTAISVSTIQYDSSTVRRAYAFPQANVWKNTSFKTTYCPWTTLPWTETSINQIYFYIWSNGVGFPTVTEIGAIVYIYEPVETDYNYIFLLFIVVGVIILLLFLGIITNRRKGE